MDSFNSRISVRVFSFIPFYFFDPSLLLSISGCFQSLLVLILKYLSQQIKEISHQLPMSGMNIKPDLGNNRIPHSHLSQCIPRQSKLADADKSDPELGDRDYAASELADDPDVQRAYLGVA